MGNWAAMKWTGLAPLCEREEIVSGVLKPKTNRNTPFPPPNKKTEPDQRHHREESHREECLHMWGKEATKIDSSIFTGQAREGFK